MGGIDWTVAVVVVVGVCVGLVMGCIGAMVGLGSGAMVGGLTGLAVGIGPGSLRPSSLGTLQQYQHIEFILGPYVLNVSVQNPGVGVDESQQEFGLHIRNGFSTVVQSIHG